MKNLCEECKGKCCVGIIEVYPEDAVYHDEDLTIPSDMYGRVMRLVSGGKCSCLSSDGKCGIYNHRPTICKDFKVGGKCCMNFANGKTIVHNCVPCMIRQDEL